MTKGYKNRELPCVLIATQAELLKIKMFYQNARDSGHTFLAERDK